MELHGFQDSQGAIGGCDLGRPKPGETETIAIDITISVSPSTTRIDGRQG